MAGSWQKAANFGHLDSRCSEEVKAGVACFGEVSNESLAKDTRGCRVELCCTTHFGSL
jgi:hypothetical protein